MVDWRQIHSQTQARHNQLSGNNAKKGGLFTSFIDACSSSTQTATLIYAGGQRSIPIPMPFDSTDSWIRSIPEAGATAILGYRSDTEDTVFLTYENSSPANRLEAYANGTGLYRPLNPGEHEIHSTGLAQSYYCSRPILEQRAGVIRSWLDEDKVEMGGFAPLHTRQIWEHVSNEIGDEERLGAVKRPLNFLTANPATAVLAQSPTSYIFSTFPYPDYSIPTGLGATPAGVGLITEATAEATLAALQAVGEFEQRTFAKEYLLVINNPLYPTPPNEYLIDFREGQVFDDDGVQTVGSHGAYLRSSRQYFTTADDATSIEIDEVGNIDWTASLVATAGFTASFPAGGWNVTTSRDISFTSDLGGFSTSCALTHDMTAGTDFTIEALTGDFSLTTDIGDISVTAMLGGFSQDVTMNTEFSTDLNFDIDCGADFSVTAIGSATIQAPEVDIGPAPSQSAVNGDLLATFLTTFLNGLIAAAPALTTGNLGAPTPMNPALLTILNTLVSDIDTLLSTTVTISP